MKRKVLFILMSSCLAIVGCADDSGASDPGRASRQPPNEQPRAKPVDPPSCESLEPCSVDDPCPGDDGSPGPTPPAHCMWLPSCDGKALCISEEAACALECGDDSCGIADSDPAMVECIPH